MYANTRLLDQKTVLSIVVGDSVTTEYFPEDANIKRTVTRVDYNCNTGSTIRIWASDGDTCACCNRPLSKPVNGVDGAWFLPVMPDEEHKP